MTTPISVAYKGYEIETDEDGHITVWDGEAEHWTEVSVAAAKAQIDVFADPPPVFSFNIRSIRR